MNKNFTMEHYVTVKDNDKYEVSNLGNIRNKKTGRLLTPQLNRQTGGYYRVTMSGNKDYVHRVVAKSFYDCDLKDYEVNHIDGDKSNNMLGNLEVCTKQSNLEHARLSHLRNHGLDRIVKCKYCKRRNSYDICKGKSDDFYCAYGES